MQKLTPIRRRNWRVHERAYGFDYYYKSGEDNYIAIYPAVINDYYQVSVHSNNLRRLDKRFKSAGQANAYAKKVMKSIEAVVNL